eukprot:GEMP01101072.1.p1 GENE.GEMP01101072.1~~GEMP01101072.1.p1  ORF type:complete len:102 (+),score=14.36 GEMP01101072.1:173-478(+)
MAAKSVGVAALLGGYVAILGTSTILKLERPISTRTYGGSHEKNEHHWHKRRNAEAAYVVKEELLKPNCTNEQPMCLPWWFRGCSSIGKPHEALEANLRIWG